MYLNDRPIVAEVFPVPDYGSSGPTPFRFTAKDGDQWYIYVKVVQGSKSVDDDDSLTLGDPEERRKLRPLFEPLKLPRIIWSPRPRRP